MSCRRPLVVPSSVFDVALGSSRDAWGAEALFLFLTQSWEFGIPLCRELACQYESLYDYQSLSWIRVSSAPSPTPTPTGGARTLLASVSEWAFTVGPALGSMMWPLQEKQRPRSLLSRPLQFGWGTKTHIWQMVICSRPQGPPLLREERSSIPRIGWGFQGGSGSSTSWRSFSWNDFIQGCFIWKLCKLFPCLVITFKHLIPIPSLKQNIKKLSKMPHGLWKSPPNFFWLQVLGSS